VPENPSHDLPPALRELGYGYGSNPAIRHSFAGS